MVIDATKQFACTHAWLSPAPDIFICIHCDHQTADPGFTKGHLRQSLLFFPTSVREYEAERKAG
jgi:hypothetical protein